MLEKFLNQLGPNYDPLIVQYVPLITQILIILGIIIVIVKVIERRKSKPSIEMYKEKTSGGEDGKIEELEKRLDTIEREKVESKKKSKVRIWLAIGLIIVVSLFVFVSS